MLRKAVEDDEPSIRACARAAYSPYVAAIGREPAPMRADFAARIAAGRIQIAIDEGENLLGFIDFVRRGDCMLLESVAVRPEARGRGIGKSLIRFCEDEARRAGLDAVRLYTNEKMTDNLSIYPRLGYQEVGRRTQDGFDRVFFEKRLR